MINEILLGGLMLISPVNAKEPIPIFDEHSAECLALNMYHEARGQGTAGLLAVSSVVMNRVKDERFPNTICEVVKQGPTRESWKKNGTYYPIKHRCQFSWYCDGVKDDPQLFYKSNGKTIEPNIRDWRVSVQVAIKMEEKIWQKTEARTFDNFYRVEKEKQKIIGLLYDFIQPSRPE